jgi:hypothetical protein
MNPVTTNYGWHCNCGKNVFSKNLFCFLNRVRRQSCIQQQDASKY